MKKRSQVIITFIVLFFSFSLAGTVGAQTVRESFRDTLFRSGLTSDATADIDILNPINSLINSVLTLSGVVILALVIYGGASWALAAGSEDKIKIAKKIILGGIIGLIIIFAAYAIPAFVLAAIRSAT